MRLSKTTNDTISFLSYLARSQDAVVSIDDVKSNCKLSTGQLNQISKALRLNGLIGTVRGRSGGVFLLKSPEDILIAEVLKASETDFALTGCKHTKDRCNCLRYGGKVYCERLEGAVAAFFTSLDGLTLSDLQERNPGLGTSGTSKSPEQLQT